VPDLVAGFAMPDNVFVKKMVGVRKEADPEHGRCFCG
jgi:hypothetical protein